MVDDNIILDRNFMNAADTPLDGTENSQTFEPHDGMEFESKDEAFSYYRDYANSIGFSVIIKASRRSKASGNFIDAKFACTRYGTKPLPATTTEEVPETLNKKKRGRINLSWSKTDCKACMHVKKNQYGRWVICSFLKDHNHDIPPRQPNNLKGSNRSKLDPSNRARAKIPLRIRL
ncbi:hypothetical protein ACFE04_030470 [Oxalis oulophora]